MATETYIALGDYTLGSSATEVVLTNFDQSFKDLIIVFSGLATGQNTRFEINGDQAANYSRQIFGGYSTTTYAGAAVSEAYVNLVTLFDNEQSSIIIQFINFSSTDRKKHYLYESQDGDYSQLVGIGRWEKTEAIESIRFFMGSGNIPAGANYKIYGIGA
jgi:hypothetical protein